MIMVGIHNLNCPIRTIVVGCLNSKMAFRFRPSSIPIALGSVDILRLILFVTFATFRVNPSDLFGCRTAIK